jgi:hypothetical protein
VHAVAAMLAAQHLNDLIREADAERRSALARGPRRSGRGTFLGRLGGRLGGLRRRPGAERRPHAEDHSQTEPGTATATA